MPVETLEAEGWNVVVSVPEVAPDVIVYRSGKYAIAVNKWGDPIAVSEDHVSVLEAVQNKFEKKIKLNTTVVILGDIELKRQWIIDRGLRWIFLSGEIKKMFSGDGIVIDDYACPELLGFVFNGNRDSGYTGRGIAIKSSGNRRTIINGEIYGCKDYGFAIDVDTEKFVSMTHLFLDVHDNDKGVYFAGEINDLHIIHLYSGYNNNGEGLVITSGNAGTTGRTFPFGITAQTIHLEANGVIPSVIDYAQRVKIGLLWLDNDSIKIGSGAREVSIDILWGGKSDASVPAIEVDAFKVDIGICNPYNPDGTALKIGSDAQNVFIRQLHIVQNGGSLDIQSTNKIVIHDVLGDKIEYKGLALVPDRNKIPTLSDCADLPSSGEYSGQVYVCYDSGAGKWVLKVWDGSNWQTIG